MTTVRLSRRRRQQQIDNSLSSIIRDNGLVKNNKLFAFLFLFERIFIVVQSN